MGGYVYHVLHRAVGRATLFYQEGDYAAFENTLREAKEWQPIRLLAYALMPNHWHLVFWPEHDGDVSEFLRLAHGHAHPALPRPLPYRRHRPGLPRVLQVVPRSRRMSTRSGDLDPGLV